MLAIANMIALNLFEQFPELSHINKGIERNEGWKQSFDLDKKSQKKARLGRAFKNI